MLYNFDKVVDRTATSCEKYDNREQVFGRNDVIPLWIADMDFETPDFIVDALSHRLKHPVFGYTYRNESFHDSIVKWIDRRSNWRVKPEWIDFSPGVVTGLVFAINAFTNEGDGIVIQPPVYPPFARMTKLNNRKVINNPLVWNGKKFEIDFEDLDKKLSGAKAFMISNPHNPSGRVFSRDELLRIGKLCVKHNVFIISDEIHSDLLQKPYRHTHIASLSDEIARLTITFIAPSKTFNIAGFSTAISIVSDDTTRRIYKAEYNKLHCDQGNIFGTTALEAAYCNGDNWVDQMNDYNGKTMEFVVDFLQEKIPSIKCFKPESTYLMWLDFREWGMSQEELVRFMVEDAKLGMNDGKYFGEEGIGFMRLNVASPLSVIKQAMEQLLEACKIKGLA